MILGNIMNWYKKASKSKTAPIPENFDVYEKSEKYPEWKLMAGGNDWEISKSLMAFEFNKNERVWAVISYDKFDNFTNNSGKTNDNNQEKEAINWAELAIETWIEESKKNYKENSKKHYEWDFKDSCIEVIDSDVMKPFIKEWGMDRYKWVSEDKNKIQKRMDVIKE